ncbi:hypothetical protein JZN53_004654 [Vibrio parahaemolyticus]|nr:hypothetical protein [Vibrio parahaemolyticus]EHD0108538.1 hypothetical protein [Vibrio parahaemolyticus]
MSKAKSSERLPTLARKAYESASPNQYVAFHPELLKELVAKELILPATTLLMQLKPNQRIQYVTLEELKYREVFLDIGLIKPTKKPGADRYVVPKTLAYCGIEE